VELLVVIGIIVVLIGILVPGVGMVRRSGFAAKSQSNLKQWGKGTVMWANANKECLPWEGLEDADSMPINLAQRTYWANAIPPLLDQRPYSQINEDAFVAQQNVPFGGEGESIFVDPGAQPESAAPWGYGSSGSDGVQRQFYFNYVPNSQMNNTLLANSGDPEFSPNRLMRFVQIPRSDATVMMVEMRANPKELPTSDVHFGHDVKRQCADWKRFAARHFDGGHIAFVDGHVGWVLNTEATTNSVGSRDPSTPQGDWNTRKLVWDPLGPALDEN